MTITTITNLWSGHSPVTLTKWCDVCLLGHDLMCVYWDMIWCVFYSRNDDLMCVYWVSFRHPLQTPTRSTFPTQYSQNSKFSKKSDIGYTNWLTMSFWKLAFWCCETLNTYMLVCITMYTYIYMHINMCIYM